MPTEVPFKDIKAAKKYATFISQQSIYNVYVQEGEEPILYFMNGEMVKNNS